MASLTTAARKSLPAKDFAGPDRSYPVENKAHARDALARASEEEHKGRISKGEESRIDAAAHRTLGHAVKHLKKHHAETQTPPKR